MLLKSLLIFSLCVPLGAQFIPQQEYLFADTEDNPAALSVQSVEDTPIYQDFISYSSTHRPGVAMSPKYITVHNTANNSSGADATMHSNYLKQGKTHESYLSWHYTVDAKQIYQHVPINEISYHAGDSLGSGNMQSIGIEICENSDESYRDAEENAEDLIAELLFELNMSVDQVVPHQHWSGKYCPHNILAGENGSVGWNQLIANIQEKLNQKIEKAQKENPEKKDVVSIGTTVQAQETLSMNVGDSSTLAVYQDDAYADYEISDDGNEVTVVDKIPTISQTLTADSSLSYVQTVKLLSSTYEIDNPDTTFDTLLQDSQTNITADENFLDVQSRTFKTTGLSTVRFANEKGVATYSVYNHILYDPVLTSQAEAQANGWTLQSPTMNLVSVMSGSVQAEQEKIAKTSSSLDLISIMNAKKAETKDVKEEKEEQTKAQDVKTLTFVSSDPAVATVTSDGVLVARGKGKTTISTEIQGIRIERSVVVE